MHSVYRLKHSPKQITYYDTKRDQKQVLPVATDSPKLTGDTRAKVTRPLLEPLAQQLRKCEHGVLTSRTVAHSRTLLHTENCRLCS
jgi:hypothetical protein